MTNQPLDLLQQWMKTVVTERGSLAEKLQSASDQHGLRVEDVVADKRGLSAHKRLSVYTDGYVLRLLECMRADFPALRSFVSDSVFDAFAKAYLVSHPPQSRSLFDLGAGFPQFLEETKPASSRLDDEMAALLDLPPELARIERARTEAMRAPGIEQDPPVMEPFSPLAILSQDVRLHTTPCLRLLKLKFPLVDFLRQSSQSERPEPPGPRLSFVAIGRSHYQLHTEEITDWQFAFLQACEQPVSHHLAVQRAAEESGKEPAFVLAQLVVWLPVAIELGFVRPIQAEPCPVA